MKKLIIVESPSKATKIQEFLGKNYVVMASKGHIADLAKGGKNNLGIDIENNFKPHYVLMQDRVSILDELINASKESEEIYICADPDREGEAISWHLWQRLQDVGKPIKRAVFNEIKKEKVLKGIKEAREIDMNLFHSQEARRILDRLVGFLASPFLMNFFGSSLSAGRVQSVITRMVIDREKEIDIFVPQDYWTIQVDLTKDNKEGFTSKYAGKLSDVKTAEQVKTKLSTPNTKYVVSEVLAEEEKKHPSAPLITSTLQRIMSKNYGFDAERTMKAAQSLYESGYCTYIRTDSVRVEKEALQDVRQWLTDNKYELPKKANAHKNKNPSQDAHECIRPSDLTLLPHDNFAIIDPDQKKVYEIIWKCFIASQMMPAVYNTLKVSAHLKNDPSIEVKASGKALKSKGYLEIFGIGDDSKIDIPDLQKGDELDLFGSNPVKLEKKQTQPPPRYSEDKLIKELVNKNIGRPSTFADLLGKITSRNYVEKSGNVYHATELGKKITDVLVKSFSFMDYDFTAQFECQLDEIESGKIDYLEVLKKFYPIFKSELNSAYVNFGGTLCDKCGNPMVIRTNKTNGEKFLACSIYDCRSFKSLNQGSVSSNTNA